MRSPAVFLVVSGKYPFQSFDPCLPRPAKQPPAAARRIHVIQHDVSRILAQRDFKRIRLLTRNGIHFSARFPFIVEALSALPVRSCIIDREAIVTNDNALAVFDLIREHRHHAAAELCAFDLIELDGVHHRHVRIEERKRSFAKLVSAAFNRASSSTHFSSATARSSSSTPASSPAKSVFHRGSDRPIARLFGAFSQNQVLQLAGLQCEP